MRTFPILTLFGTVPGLMAGAPAPQPPRALGLQAFLAEVMAGNLEAAATRFNVTSAEAQVSISRLLPDPELTTGISSKELHGPSKPGSPTQTTLGLAWTLELGGKRSARTEAARCGVRVAQAELEAFLGDLRATAAGAFIDALRARKVVEHKRQVLEGFQELLRMNALRHAAGDIGGVELAQGRVEARRFEGELAQAEADAKIAEAALAQLLSPSAQPVLPEGELAFPNVTVETDQVLAAARERRPELLVARRTFDLAQSQVRLAHANRWVDLGLSLGVEHTPAVRATGLEAGAPMSNALSATLSVPIPFSRRRKGELVQAESARSQAQLQLGALELRTRSDVQGALAQFEAATRQVQSFQDGILQDADKVLEGTRFSYRKGAASLTDVILAHRASAEVHMAHVDALASYARALAALDRVTGGTAFLAPPRHGK